MTQLDFLTDALIEIGAYAPGDTIAAPVLDVATRRWNYLIDEWAAMGRYAYNNAFQQYTLTPNHAPTLLGPGLTSPDFGTPNAAPRPPKILGANLILNGQSPTTDLIISVRDDAWWLAQQVKQLTSTIPTDLYYSVNFPNGELNFWPIPTVAYGVRLEIGIWITEVDPDTLGTTTIVFPQAYRKAMMLALAEDLTTALSRPMPATLPGRALRARMAVQSNNTSSPRIASADYGAGLGDRRAGFNWRSGQ